MVNLSALWDEDATVDDVIATYQYLIDTGQAWMMEGWIGRTAMALIKSGACMLGDEAHRDYFGNLVPSRHQVVPGTVGSKEYVEEKKA